MRADRRTLDWIVRNRQPRQRAVAVGRCVPDHRNLFEIRRAIRGSIASFVDDEFRNLCMLGEINGATVFIHTRSAPARDAMRLKWLTGLRSHLARTCRPFGSRQLRFVVGDGDDEFVRLADPAPRRKKGSRQE